MIFFLLILFYFSFTIAPKLQNTDLFLLMLLLSNEIAGKLYMKNGTRGKTRMNDIADVNNQLDWKVSEQNIDYMLEALPGLHAFTGCNTVSAFSGKGKIKALKIMPKYDVFINLFLNTWTRG